MEKICRKKSAFDKVRVGIVVKWCIITLKEIRTPRLKDASFTPLEKKKCANIYHIQYPNRYLMSIPELSQSFFANCPSFFGKLFEP